MPAAELEPPAKIPAVAASIPRWAVIGIFLLLLVGGIAFARDFLMPVVLAFLLALVFSPVRRFLERRRVPATVSAFLIVGTLLIGSGTGMVMLADPISGWLDNVPQIGRQLEWRLRDVMGTAEAVIEAGKQVNEIAKGQKDGSVQEVIVREPSLVASVAAIAPGILYQAVFVLILLLFLLASGDMFYRKIVHAMPTFHDKRKAMRIAFDIERQLSRYLFTITVVNAGLGLAVGIAMWLIGMPSPALFGVLAFALTYIPYFGAVAGVLIAAVVGLTSFPDLAHGVLPAAIYFGLTLVEGQLVTPYFVGRRLELNTVVIFLAIAFWAWMWSVIGMLVAVPLLVAIRTFCEHVPKLGPIGDFLSSSGNESQAPAESEAV